MFEDVAVDAFSPQYLASIDQSQNLRWISRGGTLVLQYRLSPNRWRDLPTVAAPKG
jgi:hypothetical protein